MKTMKKLQSNFTTPEQSKRLLELGVPAWTANCYYTEYGKIEIKNTALDILYPPCWSVGRLIEIYCLLVDERYSVEFIGQIHTNPMDKILSMLEYVKLDFSKLEE